LFSPGPTAFAAANLSVTAGLSFQVRGDGGTYQVLLFTKAGGFMPAVQTFESTNQWKQFAFAFADFSTDARDVTGIAFTGSTPGRFQFQLDEVKLTAPKEPSAAHRDSIGQKEKE
jgi:hypothetical protein